MSKLAVGLILSFLLPSMIISCKGEHEIGKIQVNGLQDVFVNLSQEDDFEIFTAIYYEIVDKNNAIILRKRHLTGTDLYEDNLKHFTANSYDSIIYITYFDSTKIFALFDLKSKNGYPHGSRNEDYDIISNHGAELLEKIRSYNPKLNASWKK